MTNDPPARLYEIFIARCRISVVVFKFVRTPFVVILEAKLRHSKELVKFHAVAVLTR